MKIIGERKKNNTSQIIKRTRTHNHFNSTCTMMKSLSFAFAFLAATSSAFAPVQHNAIKNSAFYMSETEPVAAEAPVDAAASIEVEPTIVASGSSAAAAATMSQSLPFLPRPAALTGALAGDVGFDPLGFAKSEADLMNYREAEVKHARLAMLAAAGWPLSEVFDKKIAAVMGMEPILGSDDRVPSLLNGGLGKISPAYWVGCIGVAAMIDIFGQLRMKSNNNDYIPGDFGLRLGYPSNEDGQKRMQLAEIKNGRLAMIAIFAFAAQEFVTKQGVVDETPLFFFPIIETLHKYANSGYIQ